MPTCTIEDPREAEVSDFILFYSSDDECPEIIILDGVAMQSGGTAGIFTGAEDSPILLPELWSLSEEDSFPSLVVQNDAGALQSISPPADGVKYLYSVDGMLQFGDLRQELCWPAEDVCEDCDYEFVATWRPSGEGEEDGRLCLMKVDKDDFLAGAITFSATNSIEPAGSGTADDPKRFHVKISNEAGNILTLKDDGLFVGCCAYYDIFDSVS